MERIESEYFAISRCPYCHKQYSSTIIGGVCFDCDDIVRGGLYFKKMTQDLANDYLHNKEIL
jgi:hypothetical protein